MNDKGSREAFPSSPGGRLIRTTYYIVVLPLKRLKSQCKFIIKTWSYLTSSFGIYHNQPVGIKHNLQHMPQNNSSGFRPNRKLWVYLYAVGVLLFYRLSQQWWSPGQGLTAPFTIHPTQLLHYSNCCASGAEIDADENSQCLCIKCHVNFRICDMGPAQSPKAIYYIVTLLNAIFHLV